VQRHTAIFLAGGVHVDTNGNQVLRALHAALLHEAVKEKVLPWPHSEVLTLTHTLRKKLSQSRNIIVAFVAGLADGEVQVRLRRVLRDAVLAGIRPGVRACASAVLLLLRRLGWRMGWGIGARCRVILR